MIPDTTCPITVAQAAPAIPNVETKDQGWIKNRIDDRTGFFFSIQAMEKEGLRSARTR